MGSAANELVHVGHMRFRMPPILCGQSWVASKRAAVAAAAAAQADAWEALGAALADGPNAAGVGTLAECVSPYSDGPRASTAPRASAVGMCMSGAAAGHAHAARTAAARRLLASHTRVLHDVANPARWTNIDGAPLTQQHLVRVHPDHAAYADEAMREVVRRLLGLPPAYARESAAPLAPLAHAEGGDAAEGGAARAAAWGATARYLVGRVQGRPEQKPGRTPDVDEAAAEAMCAVLLEVGASA
jgi:hypothetical protein